VDIRGIPALFVIGPDGRVLHFIRGYSSGDTRLEVALDHFLEQGTVASTD